MLIVSAPGQAGDCQSKEPLPEAGNTTAEPPPSLQVPEEQEPHNDVLNVTAAAESPLQVTPAQVQNSESCASSSQSAVSTPEKQQQLSQSDDLDMPEAAANELLEEEQAEKAADVVTAVGVDHQDADHPGLHGDPVCKVGSCGLLQKLSATLSWFCCTDILRVLFCVGTTNT